MKTYYDLTTTLRALALWLYLMDSSQEVAFPSKNNFKRDIYILHPHCGKRHIGQQKTLSSHQAVVQIDHNHCMTHHVYGHIFENIRYCSDHSVHKHRDDLHILIG
jgi:hypothetical protein